LPPEIDQDLNLEREGEEGLTGDKPRLPGFVIGRDREKDGKRRHRGRRDSSREKKTSGREQIRIDIFRVTPYLF
jgi:hypothetical protein